MEKGIVKHTIKDIKKGLPRNKAVASLALLGGVTFAIAACGGQGSDAATPTPAPGHVKTMEFGELNAKNVNVDGVPLDQHIKEEVDAAVKGLPTAVPTPTRAPTATPRPTPYPSPDTRRQLDWMQRVVNETGVPNDGSTSITRTLGPNQIIGMSGERMNIPYVDQYGNRQIVYLNPNLASNTVSLVFFLGDGRQTNTAHVENVVPSYNWVGTFGDMPDQNPTNPQNWQKLMDAKVQETMNTSSSIPGGASFVDVVVVDGRTKQLVYRFTFPKQRTGSALPSFNTPASRPPETNMSTDLAIKITRDGKFLLVDKITGKSIDAIPNFPSTVEKKYRETGVSKREGEEHDLTVNLEKGEIAVFDGYLIKRPKDDFVYGVGKYVVVTKEGETTLIVTDGAARVFRSKEDALKGIFLLARDAQVKGHMVTGPLEAPEGWEIKQ